MKCCKICSFHLQLLSGSLECVVSVYPLAKLNRSLRVVFRYLSLCAVTGKNAI